ncbi:hypothetical protein PR202_ga11029 [Eleusine coracana subsp. coracana]|uniref:Uncharacterized protein n=1 Tax=Eleusine coracana subsp. coracana TaxID=191504 RepID=A0AAV5C8J0_ELECO|nr:hypothetical protein PR202_ga11029 [Eleusine coracana subsp. coracana]
MATVLAAVTRKPMRVPSRGSKAKAALAAAAPADEKAKLHCGLRGIPPSVFSTWWLGNAISVHRFLVVASSGTAELSAPCSWLLPLPLSKQVAAEQEEQSLKKKKKLIREANWRSSMGNILRRLSKREEEDHADYLPISSSGTSPFTNALTAGNICPSCSIAKPLPTQPPPPRATRHGDDDDDTMVSRAAYAEEVKRAGNERYNKGCFEEALRFYDCALIMCPYNAACRGNRAAALTGLCRFGEAVKDYEEALRIDPSYGRAHQRLTSLHIRLGHIEDALKHLALASPQPNPLEWHKLQTVENHLGRLLDARKTGEWKTVLRESDAAIASGADSSALLENTPQPDSRFHDAVSSIDKARIKDPGNTQLIIMHNKVKAVARAQSLGNELFNSGKFSEACLAYGEGLKHHPTNKVMYCNRAACWFKLEQWEKSVEDCNEALKIHPNYTKALLRRAACYGKMERWAEIPTALAQDPINLAGGPNTGNLQRSSEVCANEALAYRCRCNETHFVIVLIAPRTSMNHLLRGSVARISRKLALILKSHHAVCKYLTAPLQVSNVWISSTGIVKLRGISFTSKHFSIERVRDDYKHLSRVLLALISISGGDITKLPPDYKEFIMLLTRNTLTVQDEFLIVNNSALLPMKNR